MEAPNSSLILVTSAMLLPQKAQKTKPQKQNPKPENITEEIREKKQKK